MIFGFYIIYTFDFKKCFRIFRQIKEDITTTKAQSGLVKKLNGNHSIYTLNSEQFVELLEEVKEIDPALADELMELYLTHRDEAPYDEGLYSGLSSVEPFIDLIINKGLNSEA